MVVVGVPISLTYINRMEEWTQRVGDKIGGVDIAKAVHYGQGIGSVHGK
jgi:hypothetical protein